MKKLIIVTVIIMLASCATVKQTSAPPESSATRSEGNLSATGTQEDQDHLILATLWYQKSAEMRALYYQCFSNAETALKTNLEMHSCNRVFTEGTLPETRQVNKGKSGDAARTSSGILPHEVPSKPAAVVLDIDETLLDNSPYQGWQVIEKKPFNNDDWFRWVELARARPLPGAVEFTRYADSLGVEVFYVSNRTVQEMVPTIQNMTEWGFVNADSTHLLLKETTSSKVERRAMIEKNYEIILLVGDNLADLGGNYEKRGGDYGFGAVDTDRKLFGTKYIVLPNPMYGNWLNDILRNTPGSTEREKLIRMLNTF
ncbi:hypothetical protein EG830_10745 [bacterium]|nr:hypothetical protein [bacterium]